MSAEIDIKVHPLDTDSCGCSLPLNLNDPFDYTPHPLCEVAARQVVRHAESHPEWSGELRAGKMFGVLIVRTSDGKTGFLAAFSGNLAGSNLHPYFVPPVYDMLHPDGFFRREEAVISDINRRIDSLLKSPERLEALRRAEAAECESRQRLDEAKRKIQASKRLRDSERALSTDAGTLERLDDESRREKSQFRRLKAEMKRLTDDAKEASARFEDEIKALKSERRRKSEELQMQLFDRFVVADSRGDRCSLREIFAPTPQGVPPAGAGECAAPKLFQYAFTNSLTPIAVAEFWYGASPRGEVRRHGSFYPACRGKCKPILDFMLRGLTLERKPAKILPEPVVVYADESLAVVDKPAGMLSVDGKNGEPSAASWAARRFSAEAKPAHRLDMATSGLLAIALDADAYRNLQEQFQRRKVRKRYIALLEGIAENDEGTVDLPIRLDPTDRPRQTVDRQHGKPALTRYKVKERNADRTLIEFEPETGRTHQLRVHSASAEGLDAPIVGDTLYGAAPADRLYLHSAYIEFAHPKTGERIHFSSEPPQSFTTTSSNDLRLRSGADSDNG